MSKNEENFVKEITNIDEDFAQWYTDICIKAELADYTDSKGFVAIAMLPSLMVCTSVSTTFRTF